ncbi:membrane protein implicated in regulation of membrane protease activity [Streptomyces sp. SAI-144]|uniref:hypothetical protein n=1 Tax=Streptomyces sp. SAI-144 TaxID=2940544 RepID=UPI002476D299|nr:hypothetical protein [Streptomyces sp. SAI-144]MDH6439593.1 membrane protein implicated in regulation of membrane protease activity [Streptomyces sp. SAI-144]
MDDNPSDLLPVGAHSLSADPRLADAVRQIGSTHGYDYFDDVAVRKTLSEHEAALRRLGRGGLVWSGSLATAVGIVWLVWAAAGKPDNMAVAAAPPAALLVLALAAFVQVNLQGRRKLRHPFLEGYRHVLAAAQAHGAPVTYVPVWLTGRGGGQLEVTPLPSYATPAGAPATGVRATPVAPPPKPAEVEEYERIADQGGWHDEAGWILVVAGAVGVGYAVVKDLPAAYAAVLLIPLGIWTWLAGHRLGRRQKELSGEALRYLDELTRSQAAGAPVHELSPPLRKLLDTRL